MRYRYGTEPFAGANGRIPQLNLWDDHDVSTQSPVSRNVAPFTRQLTRSR